MAILGTVTLRRHLVGQGKSSRILMSLKRQTHLTPKQWLLRWVLWNFMQNVCTCLCFSGRIGEGGKDRFHWMHWYLRPKSGEECLLWRHFPLEPAVTSHLVITHNHYRMSLEDTMTAVSTVSFMAFGDYGPLWVRLQHSKLHHTGLLCVAWPGAGWPA